MNTYSFRKDLLAVQEELLRFAYKLTADREGSHHSCDGTADRRRDFHLYAANPQYRVFRDLISVKWGIVYEETDPSDFCGGCSGRRKSFMQKRS